MSRGWGEKVVVVLRHVPESEDFDGGYEAAAMTGVPHGVSITGSYPDSAEGALNRLLDALRPPGGRERTKKAITNVLFEYLYGWGYTKRHRDSHPNPEQGT